MLRPSRTALSSAVLVALALAYSTPAAAQARASLADLGTLGGTQTIADAINASGQVVGRSYVTGNTAEHAFLYSGGAMQDLGTLGGTFSVGNDLNAVAQITGYAATAGNSAYHAFLYSGGGMLDLGTLSGSGFSIGNGINASGQVTGEASSSSGQRAFLYSNGTMRDLGTLGGSNSYGMAINDAGDVTGAATTAAGTIHAFLYSGGVMQDLGALAAGTYAIGNGINASRQVAGYSYLSGASGPNHAFLYSNGALRDLGTLGGASSSAFAINASGQVVGVASTAAAAGHAFLYNAGSMVDLNSLAPAGWTLLQARDINDNAQVTGYGQIGFQIRSFVLTLQPDWQGGNGSWSDTGHWNFAGLGSLGIAPGAPHDVVIAPAGASATVVGPADAHVNSLVVGADPGQLVTLDLNGGSITTATGTSLFPNGVLRGSGRLGGALLLNSGSRVEVAGGQRLELTGPYVHNYGSIRLLGTASNPANLAVTGQVLNNGTILAQNANASFTDWVQSSGQVNLQNANLFFDNTLTNTGQVNVSFGATTISGHVQNLAGGRIVVSNGAQATFYDSVSNNGELRVSAGGSANFFGLVGGAGTYTGTGEARFEGGFAPGNSPALITVAMASTFSATSPIFMELGGTTPGSQYDKVVFNGPVTLEGGDLDVSWVNGWSGHAGELYDLFDWNGGLAGTFGHVNLPTLASGLFWSTGDLYTTGAIGIMAAVPEPGTYAMLLAGLSLLGFGARRKMRTSAI